MASELEEGSTPSLDFNKLASVAAGGVPVIPAVAQDVDSGRVLLIGYVSEEALRVARERRLAVFWSTSRHELWIKGETSGDRLELVEIRVNCEQNALLYRVRLQGQGACHTRDGDGRSRPSCFYRVLEEGELRHAAYPAVGDPPAGA